MSKSLGLNRTDTAVSGVTSLTLPRAVLNFAADFKVKSNTPEEAIITNLTSPIDAPETFRFAVSPIKDIYRNSGIEPTMYSPSRRGVNLLVQVVDTLTVTDSADTAYKVMLPIEAHLVCKIPANELVTEDVIIAFIGRLTSGLFDTGLATSARAKALLRGSLLPSDL